MNKTSQPHKGRMIHIRLDDDTHRRLKIHAAQFGLTIQQTVENLINLNLFSTRRRNPKT